MLRRVIYNARTERYETVALRDEDLPKSEQPGAPGLYEVVRWLVEAVDAIAAQRPVPAKPWERPPELPTE